MSIMTNTAHQCKTVRCDHFSQYEDEFFQHINIAGLILRAITKIIRNSSYKDKYVHKKCAEFAQAGIESVTKLEGYMNEIRKNSSDCPNITVRLCRNAGNDATDAKTGPLCR